MMVMTVLDYHLLEECACELLESGLRADFRLGLREVSRTFDVRILPIFTCNIIIMIIIIAVIIIIVIFIFIIIIITLCTLEVCPYELNA